ncbi:TetR/AcrR family transcriptional regulator [Puniceicoccaceae bacterium K14]|nr:TetR/AcrR family transcriptional regulator [Puniceicoccaceae bacterium K14]
MSREDVSEARVGQILEAAGKLFSKKGIDGASMSDLSVEAGLSKASLYHYFKSKEEIIEALVHRIFSCDESWQKELVEASGTAVERLERYVEGVVELVDETQILFPVVLESFARSTRAPSLFQCISGYFEGYLKFFTVILEQGKLRGEFSESFNVEEAALAVLTQIEGCIMISGITGRDVKALLPQTVRYLLHRL